MKKILLVLAYLLFGTIAFAQVPKQYQEDSAHADKDLGTMTLGVRNDAGAALSGGDGDYTPLRVDSTGRMVVTGSIAVGGTGATATFSTLSGTAFGSIGAAYALGFDPPDDTKVVVLDNQTNGDVLVSMTAGATDTFHLKAGDVLSLNLASSGLTTTAAIQLKDGTAASTSGTFYISTYK